MAKLSKTGIFFVTALVVWIGAMVMLFHTHQKKQRTQKDQVGSDVVYNTETRYFYTITKDGQKVGYRTEIWINRPNLVLCTEETVLKMNLSGLSREVFFQNVVGIDSTTHISRQVTFTLLSGAHSYVFDGTVRGDSLNIKVQKSLLEPKREGTFIIDEYITFPVALSFMMHHADTEIMSFKVFDPVTFTIFSVDCARRGMEKILVDGENRDVRRYDLIYNNRQASMWLDERGILVKADGYFLFSGDLGDFSLERTVKRDVFLLPVDVTLGNDYIKSVSILPDKPISSPRQTTYLKIELDGIRAANIDVSASNKNLVSLKPVIFELFTKPVIEGDRKKREIALAAMDTSLVGSSDYIQPKDGRIQRTAREIVSTEQDTLAMAKAVNQWVFKRMKKVKNLDLVRSIDILKELKGDCDEYTKLFTALTRSLGIPTQIEMGLIYENGAFRYHSWPSVFVDGVWYSLDPTLGQDTADATHLVLMRGDFERLIDVIRIIKRISIKVVDKH